MQAKISKRDLDYLNLKDEIRKKENLIAEEEMKVTEANKDKSKIQKQCEENQKQIHTLK